MNQLIIIAFCISLLLSVMSIRIARSCNDIEEIKRILEKKERKY